jgi:L-2-hydroxyglutarate oxidase LhgO
MTIPATLRAILLADATVSGLVSTRVYPVKLPQSPTMPAMVITLVGGQDVISHSGPAGVENPTFQIDFYGETYSQMDSLYEAGKDALNGYSGLINGQNVQGIFLVQKRDLPYDDDASLYRRTVDFSIWNEE